MTANQLWWLAGILEAEGSFIPAPPSNPTQPRISIAMTDLQPIQQCANWWSIDVTRLAPRKSHHKPVYRALKRGKEAVQLMEALRPAMSVRRQYQIDRALQSFQPRKYKLSWDEINEIRQKFAAGGITKYKLADQYQVDEKLIRQIIKNSIYHPDRDARVSLPLLETYMQITDEHYAWWLAGYLEGEGSFCVQSNAASISVDSTDKDIIDRLVDHFAGSCWIKKPREVHWSECWGWTVGAWKAICIMNSVHAVMSPRRQQRITEILNKYPLRKPQSHYLTTPYVDWLVGQAPLLHI